LFTELGKVLGPVLTPVFDGLGKSIQGLALLVKDTFSLFSLDNIQAALGSVGLGNLLGDYRKAREEKQKIDTEYDQRAKAEEARDDRQLSPQEIEAIKERERIKSKEAAEARQKEREKQEAKQKKAEDRARAALDKQLANVEDNRAKQELVQEALYTTGQISESTYQIEITRIQEEALRKRLDVFRTFGKETTVEAGRTANELLAIEQAKYERLLDAPSTLSTLPGAALPSGGLTSQNENSNNRRDAAGAAFNAETGALKQKFEAALITEGDYQLRSLELKRAFIDEELAILRSASVQQTEEITKRENDKAAVEKQIQEQRLENAQRLDDAKKRMEEAGSQAFMAAIDLGIELLSKDQEARKKHAQVIKAFEIGQVAVQGITEIQKIFAKNASIIGVGTAVSIAESIPAALRTTAAIVKISRQKFAGGGDTGNGYGSPDETGERPAGIVHANEYVVPRWMRNVPGVENTLGWMENIRLRGYAQGGFVTANTTPTFNLPSPQNAASGVSERSAMAMQAAAQTLLAAANNFPRTVKGEWVYTDLETVGNTLNQVRSEAQV
jgi:hypothetical protein